MEFDKSKVYTALNADELKVGSKVILANTLKTLKEYVEYDNHPINTLERVDNEECSKRFFDGTEIYSLAYFVEESEGLKWTDLKVGDVIRLSLTDHDTLIDSVIERMIIEIDRQDTEICHVRAGTGWLSDKELKDWEKVE